MNEERKIIIASESGISIRSSGDIADTISECLDVNVDGLILTQDDLGKEFFDLRSGLAGELFQKFVIYNVRAAIVLPNPDAFGKRFSELAYEHKSHSMIRFVRSKDEAISWLSAY
ncbi:MAG: DUF4180 domain-containing protein [Blastocatellia bacterium]|nr:DUF4180 domain-containing protein [Blastocatellia bacterium]